MKLLQTMTDVLNQSGRENDIGEFILQNYYDMSRDELKEVIICMIYSLPQEEYPQIMKQTATEYLSRNSDQPE